MTGRRHPAFWSGTEGDARFDLHDLKGVLEEFFQQFGVRGLVYTRRDEASALFVESASIQLGRQEIGRMGQLLPPLARKLDLRDAVLLAELDLDLLLARRNVARTFKPLPAFPSIRRDIAMILPEATTHDTILMAVKKAKPAHLEQVDLFDVFRGDNVPQGQKSVAYAFTYRSLERTLTDAEVNKAHEALVKHLKEELNAVFRDS
jgi:phenylalanyl-tRNA synthetase beta chain